MFGSMFRKKIFTPFRVIGDLDSPYGAVTVDEWQDHFRFLFEDGPCFFVSVEGDLMHIAFNPAGIALLEKEIQHALWLLNSAEVAVVINPKFGNKPQLRFSAALYENTDEDKRTCVLLPHDTSETAIQRFESVWYKQAPISGYAGKFATYVE